MDSDRMFLEENMYTFVHTAAIENKLSQTARILPLVKQLHDGQTRKGKDAIPYISHPLMMACHAFALGIRDDDILSAILLHDVCEDCSIGPDELPVNTATKTAVVLVTFCKQEGESKTQSKQRYYAAIKENKIATIVKVIDRCNNISTMSTAFSKKKMIEYINETEEYVLPLLDSIKHSYPELYNASFLIKYQMLSILKSLKRIIID